MSAVAGGNPNDSGATLPGGETSTAPRGHEQASKSVSGLLPPIVTPMCDGRLDTDSLKRELDDLAGHVSGYLVGGSLGEATSLTLAERIETMRIVAEFAQDDHTLVFSISDNSVETSRVLASCADELGADLLIACCPTYYQNTDSMVFEYFAALSELTSSALCLYDNPIASNTSLSVETIAALASRTSSLTHVKVTDTALGKVEALREQTSLTILAGDDQVLWHQLRGGAVGGMVGLPMIYPERCAAFWAAFSSGADEEAYAEYRKMSHFIHVSLGAPDYVGVIKTVLHHRGVIASPESRVPLLPLTASRRDTVIAAL